MSKLDEPTADHSLLPIYLLSRLAARYVKVVLGGDGGDELFGGYPTYFAHQIGALWAMLPARLREPWPPLVARLPSSEGYQRLDWRKAFVTSAIGLGGADCAYGGLMGVRAD